MASPLPSRRSVTHQMRSVSRERPKFSHIFHYYCGTLFAFTRSSFHGTCSTFQTSCGSCEVLPRGRCGLTTKSTRRHSVTGFRSNLTKDDRASKMSRWASCSSDELLWSRMLRRCTHGLSSLFCSGLVSTLKYRSNKMYMPFNGGDIGLRPLMVSVFRGLPSMTFTIAGCCPVCRHKKSPSFARIFRR